MPTEAKWAIAVSRSHLGASRKLAKSILFCFPRNEDFSIFPVAILTRFNHHLLPKINDVIRLVTEHGLVKKWYYDYIYGAQQAMIKERRAFAKHFSNGLPNPLNRIIILKVRHISGAFMILSIGYSIAIIAFLFELLIGKKMQSISNNTEHKQLLGCQRKFLVACEQVISDDCMFSK